jgi:hypothetical protein
MAMEPNYIVPAFHPTAARLARPTSWNGNLSEEDVGALGFEIAGKNHVEVFLAPQHYRSLQPKPSICL